MPTYTLQGPDGRTYKIDGPEGATVAQLAAVIRQQQGPRDLGSIQEDLRAALDAGDQGRAETLSAEMRDHPNFAEQREEQLHQVNERLGPEQASPTLGAVRSGLQGLTFGLSDELGAATTAGYEALANDRDFSTEYGILHDKLGDERERFAEENPGTALTAELAGGALTGGAGLAKGVGKMAGKSLLAKGGTAAGIGATEGALYGAAQGTGAEDRIEGALEGGAIGALASPVAGAAAHGVGRLAAPVAKWTSDKLLVSPQRSARRFLADFIDREGLDAEALREAGRKMGDNAVLADASDAARSSLEGVLTIADQPAIRNAADELFRQRNQGQVPRLLDDLQSELQVPPNASYGDVVASVKQRRKSVAGPLYDEARRQPLRATEKLQSVLNADAVKTAARKAEKTLSNKRIAGDQVSHIDYMDAIKQNLDDQIGAAMRQGEKGTARDIIKLKNELVSEVDEQIPAYKAARDAYAGDARLLDAAEYGGRILREDAGALDDVVGSMSESEKQMFRLGAQRAIRDKMMQAADTHNATKRLNSQLLRERMRRAFPSEKAYQRFIKRMEIEDDIFRTSAILGNSRTAARQEIKDMVKGKDIPGLEGGLTGMLGATARRIAGAGLSDEAQEELARLTMTRLHGFDLDELRKSKEFVKLPKRAKEWLNKLGQYSGVDAPGQAAAVQTPIGVVGALEE